MAENEIPGIDWSLGEQSNIIEPSDFIDSEAEEDKYKKTEEEDTPVQKKEKEETPEIDWNTYTQAQEAPYTYEPFSVQVGDIGMGDSKWDTKRPITLMGAQDMNERRAERQSTGDKWANGLIKGVGKTGTNVFGGVIGTIYGAGSAIANGSVSKIWDNSIMHALDDANEWMDEKLPNYYTQYEREMSVWERFGTANFWSDQFTNGMSFIAGAALTEVALTAASGLSWGSALPAQVAYTGAMINRAKSILNGMHKAASATKIGKGVSTVLKADRFWDTAKIGRQMLTGAGYEAGVEARANYENIRESLTTAWKMQVEQEEGVSRELNDEEKLQIEQIARGNANATFFGNVVLVGISNMMMLGKLYGPGASLKLGYQNVMKNMGLGYSPIVKGVEGTARAAYKGNRITKALGMSEKAAERTMKGVQKAKAVGLPALYEGFVEEGGQSMLGEGAYEYAMLKHGIYGKTQTVEMLDAFKRSFIQTYGDPDGQTEVALGFMLGLLGMPGGKFNNGAWTAAGARLNEVKERHTFEDYAADYYNKHGKDILTSFKSYADFMTAQQELSPLMDKAIAENNIAEYKNLQNDLFFSYVKAKILTGQFADIQHEADMIREMDDAQFIDFMGYEAKDFTDPAEIAARKNKMADGLIAKAKQIQKAFNTVDKLMKLDNPEKWTNDQISEYREKMAHRLASLDLMDDRMMKLEDALADMTGGTVSENSDNKKYGDARTIVYEDADGKKHEFTVGAFSASTLKHYYKRLLDILAKPEGKLNVPSQFKNEQEYREYLNSEIDRIKGVLNTQFRGVVQADTLTEEELELYQLFADQIEQWKKDDPVNGSIKENEVIQILKDLRHLRARKQQFVAQLNNLRRGKDEALEQHYQEIERFVDDVNKEDALPGILDQEAKDLFNKYGTSAKFRVGDTWYRFTESGTLIEDGDASGAEVDSKILRGLPLDNIVTDAQEKAKKAIEAINALKSDKGHQLEKVQKDIQDLENEILNLMIEIEEEGLEDQIKTGRKQGKFISVEKVRETHKKIVEQIETGEQLIKELKADQAGILKEIDYLTEITTLHFNPRTNEFDVDPDQRYEAEYLMLELEAIRLGIPIDQEARFERAQEINLKLEQLVQDEKILQQQLDADVSTSDTQIIEDKLKSIRAEGANLMTELKAIQNAPKMSSADRLATVQVAQEIRESVEQWVSYADENIQLLNESLNKLKEHRDVIEKMLFDRLKQLGKLGLDTSLANNMQEAFIEQVKQFELYIEEVENRENLMRSKDETPEGGFIAPKLRKELSIIQGTPMNTDGARIKGVPAEILELELDQNQGIDSYSQLKIFLENNPNTFEFFSKHIDSLNKIEKALDDVRLLKQDLNATGTEIQEIKGIINEIKNQRIEGDVDNALSAATNIIKAAQFLDAYDEVVGKLLELEQKVLQPISNDQAQETTENEPKKHTNPVTQNVTVKELVDANVDLLFRPDISYPGFMKTAGSLAETNALLLELSQTDGNGDYVLDDNANPIMREGLSKDQQNAWKAAIAQKIWFMATSNYLQYSNVKNKKGKIIKKGLKLMVVHSNNVPAGLETDLKGTFWNPELDDGLSKSRPSGKKGAYSDTSTSDPATADIKVVLTDASGKPYRVDINGNKVDKGGFLVHTSLMNPNLQNEDGTFRFTNEQGYSDSTLQAKRAEWLQDRTKMLNSSENALLDITGMSSGMPNVEGGLHPILGRVIGTHKNSKKSKDVVVQVVKKEVEGVASVEVGGHSYNVPRTGMAYTVVNGNLVPLHTRKLNIHEATNIINLLRYHRVNYNRLNSDPNNQGMSKLDMLTEAAKLTVETGKRVHIYSEVISSITRFGKGTQGMEDNEGGSVQFYDDPTQKAIIFGNNKITYEQLIQNDAAKVAQLTEFLQNKLHQVNDFKLKNKKGKTTTAAFYAPVLKEVSENNFEIDSAYKTKYANYEEYLLEKRENSDLAPPLQTNMVRRGGGYMAPQYNFRYLKFSIPGKSATKVRRQVHNQPEFEAPDGVKYSETQQEWINEWDTKLEAAKNGRGISVPLGEGLPEITVQSDYATAMDMIFGIYAPGSNAGAIPSDIEYIQLLEAWLNEYKGQGFTIGFDEFVDAKQKITFGDESQQQRGQTTIDNAEFGAETTAEQQEAQEEQTADEKADSDEAPVQDMNDILIIPPSPKSNDDQTQEEKDSNIDDMLNDDSLGEDLFDDSETNMVLSQADTMQPDSNEQQANEILRAQKMLPQQTVTIVKGFIKGNTADIVAQMQGWGQTVVSDIAPGGAVYHETFHQVSYYLLPRSVRSQMYSEVKDLSGTFKTYKGKTIKFSEANDKEIEEYLAEEFRKWILSDGQYKKDIYSAKEKRQPKGFWAKLFDNIQRFFQGFFGLDSKLQVDPKLQETAKVFNQIKAGKFANKAPLHKQDTVANMALLSKNGAPVNARFSMDVMSSLTRHFADVIFDNPDLELSIADLEDLSNPYGVKEVNKKIQKAYRAALINMHREVKGQLRLFRDNGKTEAKNAAYETLRYLSERGLDGRAANLKSIIDTHRQFLVSIGLNIKPDMETVIEENARSKDQFGIMQSYEFSAVNTAHPYVKILLGSLPDSNLNTTGTKGVVDSNYAMNYIQTKLAGITNPTKQLAMLEQLAVTKPWIKTLLNRLGDFDVTSDRNQMRKHTMFWQQMNKTKNNFISYLIDGNGNFFSIDSNRAQLNDLVTNRWKNKLKNSEARDKTGNRLVQVEDGNLKINLNYKVNIPSVGITDTSLYGILKNRSLSTAVRSNPQAGLELFEILGFEFTDKQGMLASTTMIENKPISQIVNETVGWLFKEMAESTDTGADLFNKDNINIQSRLGNLLKAEMLFNDEVVELRHLNAEGKPVYGLTLNTYVSLIANKLNQREDVPHLKMTPVKQKGRVVGYKVSKNIYASNSLTLQEMLKDPDATVEINVIEGARVDKQGDKGLHTSKLTHSDRTAIYLNSVLQGNHPLLRTADAKTEYAVKLPIEQFYDIFQAKKVLLGYFQDEVQTVINFRQRKVGQDIKTYKDEGGNLRFFHHIVKYRLNKSQNKELDSVLNGKMAYKDFMYRHGAAVFKSINGYLKDEVQKNIDLFIKQKIVEKDGPVFKNNAIDSQTIGSLLGNKNILATDKLSTDQLNRLVEIFTLNNFISNIEQTKLFFGDPAFYSDFYKRTKLAAGTKKYARTDAKINGWLNNNPATISEDIADKYSAQERANYDGTSNIYVSADPTSESIYADEYALYLDKMYPGKSNDYRNNMISDGMGLGTIHFYREIMQRVGDWTNLQENLFKKMMLGEKLTVEEMTTFPPIKPQLLGPALHGKGLTPTIGIKFALMPIFPQMTSINGSDTALAGLLKDMYETNTDMVMHPSAMKVGSRVDRKTGKAPNHYANDGSIAPIDPNLHTTIDLSYFGIQVDMTKEVKDKVTVGTQSRTHILADRFKQGMPIDWEGSLKEWHDLTEAEKDVASPIYKQAQELKALTNEFTRRTREDLLKRFNIERVTNNRGETSYRLKNGNMDKFADMIREELTNRQYPENVAAGIEYLLNQPDGNKRVFDILTNKNRLENLLFSLVGKNSIRQKFKGDQKVQVSSMGFETEVKAVKQKDSGVVMSGDVLKFYRKADPNNEGSETLGMEVYMPHHFKEYFGTDLIIGQDGIYNENGEKIGEANLLNIIGFRIPTDGLHSIDFIKIKGFLPPGTNQIVVPSELATKAGSDYDIDKLTLYFPSYRMAGNKYLVKREYIDADTNTKEGLTQYYDSLYGPTLRLLEAMDSKTIDEIIKDDVDQTTKSVNKLMAAIFGEDALGYSEEQIRVLMKKFGKTATSRDKTRADRVSDVLDLFDGIVDRANEFPTLEQFVKENKGKHPSELNHKGAIQNRIMDITKDILADPQSYATLLNPIGINTLLELRDEMGALDSKPSYAQLISYTHINKITRDFQSGKDALGIAAVAATHIVKSQQANLFYKNDKSLPHYLAPLNTATNQREYTRVGFNFAGFKGKTNEPIDFSRITDITGTSKISDLASEFVNVYADVSEDPIVADLNIVPEVANAMWGMLRGGVPIDSTIFFLNQPIIKEYLNEMSVHKSKFLTARSRRKGASNILDTILNKYSKELAGDQKQRVEDVLFTRDQLKDMIGKNMLALKNGKQLKDQIQILEDFIMYDALGQKLSDLTNATSFDTREPKSRNEARLINSKFDDIYNKGYFANVDRLIEDTHLKEFRYTHQEAEKFFNIFFLTERAGPRAVGELDAIFNVFSDSDIFMDDRDRLAAMKEAENDLITAALSSLQMGDKVLFDKIENLFFGERSVAKRVASYQTINPGNPFIDGLLPVISPNRVGEMQDTDNIKFYSRVLNNYEANLLRDAFLELPTDLQNMIIEFGILQSGLSTNNMSFLHLVPTELYAQKAVQIVSKLDPQNTSVRNFFDNFFRNNWNNPKIVPRLPKSKWMQRSDMPFPLERPSIKSSDPTGKFPYVAIVTTAEAYTDIQKNKKSGVRNKTYVKLFKNMGLNSRGYYNFQEVKKLGNGNNLKEFPIHEDGVNEGSVSILEKNNLTKDQTIAVYSQQKIRGWGSANVNLSEWALKGIRTRSSRIIAAPVTKGTTMASGIYLLPDSTKVRIVKKEIVSRKDLEKRGELDNFARKQGFKSWDSLVDSINRPKGGNHIPKSFLNNKSKITIFDVVAVDETRAAAMEASPTDTVVIASLSPETYDVQDVMKLGPNGGSGTAHAKKALAAEIQKQLEQGKRHFTTSLKPGAGMLATELLLNVQTDMINRNEQLNLTIGTLSKDYLAELKKENPLWHKRYLDLVRRTKRNRSNQLRSLSKLPSGKTEIKLNTKELQEILKAEDKTDCG